MNNKATLRARLRSERQGLGPQQQQRASQNLLKRISRLPRFIASNSLAFYLAADGEIDPLALLVHAHARGKACYLPVIRDDHTLGFKRYRPGDPLQANRYGIPEPCGRGKLVHRQALDIVFLPLVAFDRRGGRLGMGGGFYDRTFQCSSYGMNRPLLVGLGHAFQEVETLELEDWDVKLAAIATDKAYIKATGR